MGPTNQVVLPGADVNFTVIATGSEPLTYRWQYNGLDIPGATSSILTLANVDNSQAGYYSVIVRNDICVARAYATLATYDPFPTLHRLSSNALNFGLTDGIDAPLNVTNSAAILRSQPEIGWAYPGYPKPPSGLVADGVTPLLIKFTLDHSPAEPVPCIISLSTAGGQVRVGGTLTRALTTNLFVLAGNNWIPSTNLVMTTNVGFAYIAPIKADDLLLDAAEVEMTVTLTVRAEGSLGIGNITIFKIRKPPVVLIHGYAADKSTWGSEFTDLFALGRSSDFVIPINYGVPLADTDVIRYF